jgi:hypothetical protein
MEQAASLLLLLGDAISISDYIASNGRMSGEE